MNGTREQAAGLIDGLLAGRSAVARAELVVCPPYTLIPLTADKLSGTDIGYGGQNLDVHPQGAYTGEISAAMLGDFGCRYVIVGHSERRALYAENDATVAEKFQAAGGAGLIPILCVGETLDEREANRTEKVVGRQLDAVLNGAGVKALQNAIVAYEPVWAIGTGRTATAEQAQQVHHFIRERVAAADGVIAQQLRILYGGSVKPDNAGELFAGEDIDGGLIGGASLDADSFLEICRAA